MTVFDASPAGRTAPRVAPGTAQGTAPQTAPTGLPLLAPRDLTAPIVWRGGQAISAHQLLRWAERLAQRLPPVGQPINLCQDRLLFAVALLAAWLRGQSAMLPPNGLPATLEQLPAGPGPAYVLIDTPLLAQLAAGSLPCFGVSLEEGGLWPALRPQLPELPELPIEQHVVCLLTSGSTGAPQPHSKRFGPLVANIQAEAERLAQLLERPNLVGLTLVATVPAQHSYGLESSVLLALLGGAAFEAGRPFYPADIAAALAAVPQPRALVTTPFHLKALLLSGIALPPVDLVLSATAPLSPQLAAQAEAAMGARLVEIYGCTEAGQVATRRTTAGDTWQTLGALRIHRETVTSGAAAAHAAANPAEDASTGAVNTARGSSTAATGDEPTERFIVQGGYVTEPTPLADVLVLQDAQHFRLLGRANDLIHVAGKRSSLAHLNFQLNRIEGVEDGAFWLPDPHEAPELEAVQRPVAFVVAPQLGASAIIAALRLQLDAAFVPRRVVHVASLPREGTGKLTASALRQFALLTLRPKHEHRFTIATDHPAFAGHFPGHPVLPGVVLLSLVMRALQREPALQERLGATPQIEQVKFLSAVGPGAEVQVSFSLPAGSGKSVGFELQAQGRTVAKGQLGPQALAA
jgi:acyl-CoA synthetase (AMP-forming)/AMP-acid ligase II